MSLAERALGRPTVSLRCLLTGTSPDIAGDTAVTLADYAEEIVRSGFPGIRRLPARACRAQLDGYLSRASSGSSRNGSSCPATSHAGTHPDSPGYINTADAVGTAGCRVARIAPGQRARGFKSRHPTVKSAVQEPCYRDCTSPQPSTSASPVSHRAAAGHGVACRGRAVSGGCPRRNRRDPRPTRQRGEHLASADVRQVMIIHPPVLMRFGS